MRVHPSNFRIVGFTEKPRLQEVVELARQRSLMVLEDLGSGCVVDIAPLGLQEEPPVVPSLKAGVDVVTFSGDKLLGGPQAGILAGKREPLARIRRNPLFRALRVDKLTIAALEATIDLYLRGNLSAVPALRMIYMQKEEIAARAARLARRIAALPGFQVELEDGESVIGGGSTPGQSIPTKLIAVTHAHRSATELAALLRENRPPIVTRLERDRVLFDLRTVFESQEEDVFQAHQGLQLSEQA